MDLKDAVMHEQLMRNEALGMAVRTLEGRGGYQAVVEAANAYYDFITGKAAPIGSLNGVGQPT